jgi:hypothetical protein
MGQVIDLTPQLGKGKQKRRQKAVAAALVTGSLVPGHASQPIAGAMTLAQVADAEAFCRKQLLAFAKWLRVDETKIEDGDRALCDRVLATVDGDGTAYEKALAFQPVNDLFARGVLHFERPLS